MTDGGKWQRDSKGRTAGSFALGTDDREKRLPQPDGEAERLGRVAQAIDAAGRIATSDDDGGDSGDADARGAARRAGRLALSKGQGRPATPRARLRIVQAARKAAGIGPERGGSTSGVAVSRESETDGPTQGIPRSAARPAGWRRRAVSTDGMRGTCETSRSALRKGEEQSPLAKRQARMNQEAARAKVAGGRGADAAPKAGKPILGPNRAVTRSVWKAAGKGAGHGLGSAAAAGAGAAILPLLVSVLLAVTVVAAISGSAARKQPTVPVGGNEAYIARYLMTVKGLDDVHAAAILGNIQQESGFDPNACQSGDAEGAADLDSGVGFGICQWSTAGHKSALRAIAAEMGLDWSDIAVQCEYLGCQLDDWDYADSYTVNPSSTDPPYPAEVSGSRAGFDAAADVDEATRQACYGWINFAPGTPAISRRIANARAALDAIRSGELSGNTAVTDAALLAASWATTYVYGGNDIRNGCDCSYFTSWCYAQAGITIPRNSEAQRAAGTVVPISQAQPGDVLWMPGHVGIYLGPDSWAEQTPPRIRVVTGKDPAARWTAAVRF